MNNVIQTIISQYGNSPRLLQMINDFNDAVDPSQSINDFYDVIWNIETAQGFGLDIWGKIVGVDRKLTVPATTRYLGFDEANTTSAYGAFGSGVFYSGPQTGSLILSDDAYRVLIYLKALANISDATIPSYNKLLQFLFGTRGRCYVIDEGNMSVRGVFEFYLTPYELAILTYSGVVPRPAGVKASILQVNTPKTFGFAEAGAGVYQPFGYGSFGQSLIPIA